MTDDKDKKKSDKSKSGDSGWVNKKNLERPIGDDIKSQVTTTNSTGPKKPDNKQ